MHSFEMLSRITGDAVWADRCEELAFNSLPAALDTRQKGVHYITSANSISLGNDPKGSDFDNPWPMQAYMPGVRNYRCCPHNYGMGWPYYAEEMWLATADGGLCASLYGASEVRAQVGADRDWIRLAQATRYPFGDTIQFTFTSENNRAVAFPLALRIPGWCRQAKIEINGKPHEQTPDAGTYAIIHRLWLSGDRVTLHLPMRAALKHWPTNQNSVSVHCGPLAYSLAIKEQWRQSGGTAQWPEYEVHAASPWNYGLALESAPENFSVTENADANFNDPWTLETIPVSLTTKARRIPEWQADTHDVVGSLPPSPVKSELPEETITLVPMGAARLRITSFPVVDDVADAHSWVPPQSGIPLPSHSA